MTRSSSARKMNTRCLDAIIVNRLLQYYCHPYNTVAAAAVVVAAAAVVVAASPFAADNYDDVRVDCDVDEINNDDQE